MAELILEGGPELRTEFEAFAQQHPNDVSVEVSKGPISKASEAAIAGVFSITRLISETPSAPAG